MRSLVFEGKTWLIYEQLRDKDKKLHKALCKILKEMLRSYPSSGLGKPEPLKHNLSGLWSKRIIAVFISSLLAGITTSIKNITTQLINSQIHLSFKSV